MGVFIDQLLQTIASKPSRQFGELLLTEKLLIAQVRSLTLLDFENFQSRAPQ